MMLKQPQRRDENRHHKLLTIIKILKKSTNSSNLSINKSTHLQAF